MHAVDQDPRERRSFRDPQRARDLAPRREADHRHQAEALAVPCRLRSEREHVAERLFPVCVHPDHGRPRTDAGEARRVEPWRILGRAGWKTVGK